MFKRFRNKKSKAVPYIEDETKLGEQPDLISALKLFEKINLKYIPHNFEYKEPLVLKEKVVKDKDNKDNFLRTDYIIIPKKGIEKLSGDRTVINSLLIERFDNLITYLDGRKSLKKYVFGNDENIKRFFVGDCSKIYTYNRVEVLEVKADICIKCEKCNESTERIYLSNKKICYGNEIIINNVRQYKINPPLLKLFSITGMHIAEITHPCKLRKLDDVLDSYKIEGSSKMKIIFPKPPKEEKEKQKSQKNKR